MHGLDEHAVRRPGLQKTAGVEHGDVFARAGHDGDIVRDHDARDAHLLLQPDDLIEDLVLRDDVQRGGRLIHDQKLRVEEQAHGDAHALHHAAGELMRIEMEDSWRQIDQRQHSLHGLARRGPRGVRPVTQINVGNERADAVDGAQGVHGLLEHDCQLLPSHGRERRMVHREQIPAVQNRLTGDSGASRREQPQNGHDERRLAGAGFADDAERFALFDLQRDVVDGVDVPAAGMIGHRYVFQR